MLRHLGGLLTGLAVIPLLWIGTAWSAAEIGGLISGPHLDDPMLLSATAVVIAIGVVCGLLSGSRVSPLAALLPGAALLPLSLWPLVDYPSMQEHLPGWLGPESMLHPVGPALPVNLALGALLFISALAPSRWRSRPVPPLYSPAPNPPTEPWHPEETGAHRPAEPEGDPAKTTVPMRREGAGATRALRGGAGTP